MKKLKTITILIASALIVTACTQSKKEQIKENEPLQAKTLKKQTKFEKAPGITITDSTTKAQTTKNRKKYIEVFNSTNNASIQGMKDIEDLYNDPNKDFDVEILIAPNVNGEKSKEDFLTWFNQQEHHNFNVNFTNEETLKKYNAAEKTITSIYIDSDGNLNQTSSGKNIRPTNDAIKSYMAKSVK